MEEREIDKLARITADALRDGATVRVILDPCPKCGAERDESYRPNGIPTWTNRWTCSECGRHESR